MNKMILLFLLLDVHLASRNASTTQSAKLLVFFVKNIGAPPIVAAGKADGTR